MGYTKVTQGLHLNQDRDLAEVFRRLDKASPGIYKVPDEDREIFISCAKQYADIYGTVCFNSDYTKLKKLHEWKQPTNEL